MWVFAISFLVSVVFTPAVMSFAHKRGWVDGATGGRKVHKKPVPRLGGVAIYLATLCAVGFYFVVQEPPIGLEDSRFRQALMSLFVGGSIMWIVGLVDDLWGLAALKKLGFQILASLIAFWGGIQIRQLGQPLGGEDIFIESTLMSGALTVFWIVFVTNAINLIDGLDGLAGGVCLITALSLFFISQELAIFHLPQICLALVGACLGFLIFNFSPARIFLGDSGSLFLGFILACLSVMGTVKRGAAIVMFGPPLILAVPVADTLWAVFRRFIRNPRGEPGPTHLTDSLLERLWARLHPKYLLHRLKEIFVADQNHIHHGLIRLGLSHRRAVIILYGVSALLAISAYRVATSKHLLGVLSVGLVLVGALFWVLKNVKNKRRF